MNIRDLKYVVALADEGHFGRAAERCHVSQPALSAQVQKLEAFLCVTLFERSKRGATPTATGRVIVAQARELLQQADAIIATAKAALDPLSGTFTLGMITTIGPSLSPLILPAIKAALPDVSITLVEGYTVDLERRLKAGELDAVILATEPEGAGLSKIDLYDEPFLAAFSKAHPLARRKRVKLEELEATNLLLLSDGHCLRDQILGFCKTQSKDSANTRETSLETLVSLVAIEDSATLLPALAWSKNNRSDSGVSVRPIAQAGVGRRVNLSYRASCPKKQLRETLAAIIRKAVPATVVQLLPG